MLIDHFGGADNGISDEAFLYDGTSWSTCPSMPAAKRARSGTGATVNNAMAIGGLDGSSNNVATVEEFSDVTTTAEAADIAFD